MITIAMISQKGGTGKTTLALNLATAAEATGHTALVVDLDPQASASAWSDHREADAPAVVSAQASRLSNVLEAARGHGAEVAVIDTAPHSERSALAAARAADLVLVPCRPGIFDLRAVAATVEICALAGTATVAAVLNAVPARGSLAEEAAEALAGYGLAVAPVRVGHRVAFVHAATAGLTALEFERGGKGAAEVRALYAWARERTAGARLEVA